MCANNLSSLSAQNSNFKKFSRLRYDADHSFFSTFSYLCEHVGHLLPMAKGGSGLTGRSAGGLCVGGGEGDADAGGGADLRARNMPVAGRQVSAWALSRAADL